MMIFRSYSQEATINSEPFSIDEAFNLFFPVSFTLSMVDFICHHVAQLLSFVQPIHDAWTFLLSTNLRILCHQQISPSCYSVTFNIINNRHWTVFPILTVSLIQVGSRKGTRRGISRSKLLWLLSANLTWAIFAEKLFWPLHLFSCYFWITHVFVVLVLPLLCPLFLLVSWGKTSL